MSKPLLRKYLAGRVPDEIVLRRGKVVPATLALQGLREAAEEVRSLLRQSRAADLGLVEPSLALEAFETCLVEKTFPPTLWNLIATEGWLRAWSA